MVNTKRTVNQGNIKFHKSFNSEKINSTKLRAYKIEKFIEVQ